MRGPLCKVCTSPQRDRIDADLVSGLLSLRKIAEKYGYTHGTLHNHRIRCMRVPPTKRPPNPPDTPEKTAAGKKRREEVAAPSRITALEAALPTREDLCAMLDDVAGRLDNIITKNEAEGGVDVVAISGLSNLRQTVDAMAKIAGHTSNVGPVVNVGVSVQFSPADIASEILKAMSGQSAGDILEITANVDQ